MKEGNELSDVGKRLIEEIIERKLEEVRAEKLLNRWSYTTIVCFIVGGIYFVLNFSDSFNFLHMFVTDLFMFIIAAIFCICLLQVNLAKKRLDKAEEEYDSLRFEMIERSEEIWNTEELWRERDYVYEQLKKVYDVNLYHK